MNIVVDHGNTAAKIGIFEDDVLKEKHVLTKIGDLTGFLANFSGESIILSSVNAELGAFSNLRKNFRRTVVLSTETPLPIQNRYATPATLGMDRLAAVCGAWQLFPHESSLTIDAGTCITYELLDANGVYYGGAISPGLIMRFRAMHTFTARLPLAEPVSDPDPVGDTTVKCMQSGVIYGMVDEINGIIERYRQKYPELRIILTGGDTHFFENKLKASIFASPELVLIGLNRILSYNANL